MNDNPSNRELRDAALSGDEAAIGALLNARMATQSDDPTFKEALGLFRTRIGERDAGLELLDQAAATPGHDADARSLTILMRQAFAAQQFEKAKAFADRVLTLSPSNGPALRTAARLETQNGDLGAAETLWRRLCNASEDKTEPAIHVARLARGREDWRTQAEFADIALSQAPENAEALALAVQARIRARSFDGLPGLMQALYRHEPDRVRGYLRALGGPELAPVLAETLATLSPLGADDPVIAALILESPRNWIVSGRRAARARKSEVAIRMYKAALLVEPHSREALEGLNDLARGDLIAMRAALKSGDNAKAREHAERVVDINPTAVEAWAALGGILLGSEPNRALTCHRTCVALEPDNPWALLNLARALEAAGHLGDAAAAFERLAALPTIEGKKQRADALKSAANVRRTALKRAREAFATRQLDDAWELCLTVLEGVNPPPAAQSLLAAAKRGKLLAIRELYTQHADDLIPACERYLQLDPGQREVMVYLGRRLMADRLYDRALPIWNELGRMAPDEAYFQLQIARCCKILRFPEHGLVAAANAIRLDPEAEFVASLRTAYGLHDDDPANNDAPAQ